MQIQQLIQLVNGANAANAQGDFHRAQKLSRQALTLHPLMPEAWYNLGLAEHGLGQREAAVKAFIQASLRSQESAEAQNSIGLQLMELQALDTAENCLRRALKLAPAYAYAHSNLGKLKQLQKKFTEAEQLFKKAIELQPDFALFYSNLCGVLLECGRGEEAHEAGERAAQMAPDNPHVWSNIGAARDAMGNYEEALSAYDKALSLEPRYAEALYNKGNALNELGREHEALEAYDLATQIDPNHAEAQMSLGKIFFSRGNFEACWQKLEYRWSLKEEPPTRLATRKPTWPGGPTTGPLLLWGEQGLGDQILYGSILPDLTHLPQKKIVALDKRLIPLFARSAPEFEYRDLAAIRDADDEFVAQLPLGSLPGLYRLSSDSFIAARHPYLVADPARTKSMRQRISKPGKIVCGISWRSKREKVGIHKSIRLDQLVSPLAGENIAFVNLQYGDTQVERRDLEEHHGVHIEHIDELDNFNDIDGLAALIAACDMVITVSNSTAHLAGALGKETQLLLPFSRGRLWYWTDIEQRNLWYPSIKSFAQSAPGNWTQPLKEVKRHIDKKTSR